MFILAHTVVHRVRVKSPRKHHGGIHFDIYIYLERIANERKRERGGGGIAMLVKLSVYAYTYAYVNERVAERFLSRAKSSLFFGLFSSLSLLFETLETSFFSSSRARESHAQNTHASSSGRKKKVSIEQNASTLSFVLRRGGSHDARER